MPKPATPKPPLKKHGFLIKLKYKQTAMTDIYGYKNIFKNLLKIMIIYCRLFKYYLL